MWLIRLVFWGAIVIAFIIGVVFVAGFVWLTLDEKKSIEKMSPEEREAYQRQKDETVNEILAERSAKKAAAHTSTMQCPLCNSNNVSIMGENKKSFSAKKAVAGAVLAGGVGAVAGFAGKKNGYDCYCGDCKHRFLLKDK